MGQARRRREAERNAAGVVIAYLHPGEVSAYFTESLIVSLLVDAGSPDRSIVNILQEWSSANVSAARNALVERFLANPAGDWLLFIDADMQWDHEAIPALLASADPVERPIVGGLCFGYHDGELFPTIYRWVEDGDSITTARVRDYPRDEVIPVAATGAAFLLIHRGVLTAMREHVLPNGRVGFSEAFPWFQETEMAGKPVGEDLTFCIRAAQMGIPTHVATGVRIGHHKSQLLTEDVYERT